MQPAGCERWKADFSEITVLTLSTPPLFPELRFLRQWFRGHPEHLWERAGLQRDC